MPFFLDGNPTQGEVSEAVNYLLSNFTQNVSADPATGQITGPTGEGVGYLYKYIDVKYSDSFDGTLNFSNSPTNRAYYGLRNDDHLVDPAESTNPADYSWYKATFNFGTTRFLYYLTTGGRQIQFAVATSVPNSGWIQDSGAAIDLDITTKTNAVANFVVIRVANNSAAPTDSECISAIGRTPISGDICTVNYNAGIYSLTFKYTTGWALFQKYITGDLIVANSIVAANIAAATITATQIASNTITAGNMSVGQLSAISVNLGTVTAGNLIVGSSPEISGTGMTGYGTHIYNDGRIGIGNSSSSVVWDNSALYIKGNLQSNNFVSGSTGWQILNSGAAQFNDIVVSRNLLIASGTLSVYGTRTYMYGTTMTFRGVTYYALDGDLWIDTGVSSDGWGPNTSTFVATAGLNASGVTTYYPVGNPGYVNFLIEVVDLNYEWRWFGGATIWVKVVLWATLTGGADSFNLSYYGPGGIDWNLYKVT